MFGYYYIILGNGVLQVAEEILAWEEELVGECRILLLYVTLQVAISDQRVWTTDPIKGYSMRNAYQILTRDVPRLEVATLNSFWHANVPLKVSLLA